MPKRTTTKTKPKKAAAAKPAAPKKPAKEFTIDVDTRDLKPHPLAELLPPMSEEEYAALKSDIAINGQVHDIVLLDGKILDGRHRYRVCKELGLKPRVTRYTGEQSPTQYVYSAAIHRNMDLTQRACASLCFESQFAKEAETRVIAGKPLDDAIKGRAREKAGSLFGVSGAYVQIAKYVFEHDSKLFRECFEGREKLTRAKSQIARGERSKLIKSLAKKVAASDPATSTWVINQGDCIEILLKDNPKKPPTLIIADPPYNEGLDYGDGAKADKLSHDDYILFLTSWLKECGRVLSPHGTLIIIINDEWAADHVLYAKSLGLHQRGWIKWYETFGVNCAHKFNRTSRHLLYFTKHASKCTFNEEVFSRPSDRQTKYADARANPSGKLWDDVWIGIPRLVSGDERQPEFKTQLPLGLILPLVEGLSLPGETVFDPFSGSGTTVAAAVMSGRKGVGIEKNAERVKASRFRISSIVPTETK